MGVSPGPSLFVRKRSRAKAHLYVELIDRGLKPTAPTRLELRSIVPQRTIRLGLEYPTYRVVTLTNKFVGDPMAMDGAPGAWVDICVEL